MISIFFLPNCFSRDFKQLDFFKKNLFNLVVVQNFTSQSEIKNLLAKFGGQKCSFHGVHAISILIFSIFPFAPK